MSAAAAFGSARLVLTPTDASDLDGIVALQSDARVTAHLIDGIPDAAWKADIYLR